MSAGHFSAIRDREDHSEFIEFRARSETGRRWSSSCSARAIAMFSRACAVCLVGLILLMMSAPPASYDASISSTASHQYLVHPRRADPLPTPLRFFQSTLGEVPGRDKGRVSLADATIPSLAGMLAAPRAAAAAGPPRLVGDPLHMLLRI
jgi:hypothetical protein